MQDDARDQRRELRWALPLSVALHALIAALLIFDLPVALPQPQEEAVSAELVPPPEEPAKSKSEPPPPPPAPSPEKQEKPEAKQPPEVETKQPKVSPFVPVVRYGEENAGPKKALDGNSAEDGAMPLTPDPAPRAAAEESTETPSQVTELAQQSEVVKPPQSEPTGRTPSDTKENGSAPLDVLRDASAPNDPSEQTVAPPAETDSEVPLPEAAETPKPRPANSAKRPSASKLAEAGKLYSEQATGGPVATTAMGSVARGIRGGKLCGTELREQLLRTSPPYVPQGIFNYDLKEGTVLEVSKGAFRSGGQWYNVAFRCMVDADATRVESFAFRVGEPVPPSEWARRGLPAQ